MQSKVGFLHKLNYRADSVVFITKSERRKRYISEESRDDAKESGKMEIDFRA